jgi:hypothetical protein
MSIVLPDENDWDMGPNRCPSKNIYPEDGSEVVCGLTERHKGYHKAFRRDGQGLMEWKNDE